MDSGRIQLHMDFPINLWISLRVVANYTGNKDRKQKRTGKNGASSLVFFRGCNKAKGVHITADMGSFCPGVISGSQAAVSKAIQGRKTFFTVSAPLGQFSHRVAMSVCLDVCVRYGLQFF